VRSFIEFSCFSLQRFVLSCSFVDFMVWSLGPMWGNLRSLHVVVFRVLLDLAVFWFDLVLWVRPSCYVSCDFSYFRLPILDLLSFQVQTWFWLILLIFNYSSGSCAFSFGFTCLSLWISLLFIVFDSFEVR
jgi:hypothetical protein